MEDMQKVLFECNHITLDQDDFLLNDIHFSLPSGYILGVIGRNGTGKSSLMRAILGQYDDDFLKDEKDLTKEGHKQHVTFLGEFYLNGIAGKDTLAYREQLAFILCNTPFPLNLSAKDCGLLFGAYYPSFNAKKYRKYLTEFEIPQNVILSNLSQGQQIRQQLAFSLSYDAKVYVLDEPTGNLDVKFREFFYQKIRTLIQDGSKSVIYVSHLIEELEPFVDYLLWLEKEKYGEKKDRVIGTQKYFGTWENLQEAYQILETSIEHVIPYLSKEKIIGIEKRNYHEELLVHIKKEQLPQNLQCVCHSPSIREIMYYHAKESRCKFE